MKTTRLVLRQTTILCALLLLTSCFSGSVGRNFLPANVTRLVIGTTTKAEILDQYGPPYERIDPANWPAMHFGDDETAVILRYVYGHADLFLFDGADRFLQVEFNHSGRLVDYVYISNFSEDRTGPSVCNKNFDVFSARTNIIPGTTFKAGVLALMGANHRVLPFNKPGIAQRWYYTYAEQSKTENTVSFGQTVPKTNEKWLAVDFDAQGMVRHVQGGSDFPEDVARK